MTLYECPETLCTPFETEHGAVMHMVNKEDEAHSEYTSKVAAREAISKVENQQKAVESVDSTENNSVDSEVDRSDEPKNQKKAVESVDSEDNGTPTFPEGPNGSRDVLADDGDDAPEPDAIDPVVDDDPDDDPDPVPDDVDDGADGTAGIGALVAIAVAGTAALLLTRRSSGESNDSDDGLEGLVV